MSIGINGFKTIEHSIVVESPSLVSRERKERQKGRKLSGMVDVHDLDCGGIFKDILYICEIC